MSLLLLTKRRRLGIDRSLVFNLNLLTNTLPSVITFARASAATDIVSGVLTSYSSGTARISTANGLLIEGSRTNIAQNSTRTVGGSDSWTGANQTGPDGVANSAGTFNIGSGTSAHFLSCNNILHSAATYTVSAFVKTISGTARIQLAVGSAVATTRSNFSLTGSGSVLASDATASGIQALSNGWYRIWQTYTATANTGAACVIFFIDSDSAARALSFTGNGTDKVAVYGMQSEQASSMSSYIDTAAASVTRAADSAIIDSTNFSSWYNASEGTLVSEYYMYAADLSANRGVFSVNDTTTSNRIYAFVNTSGNQTAIITSGGVTSYSPAGVAAVYASSKKVAIGYKLNDMRGAYNATLMGLDTSGAMPVTPSRLCLGGNHAATGESLYGYIRSFKGYNVRKDDTTLQKLAT